MRCVAFIAACTPTTCTCPAAKDSGCCGRDALRWPADMASGAHARVPSSDGSGPPPAGDPAPSPARSLPRPPLATNVPAQPSRCLSAHLVQRCSPVSPAMGSQAATCRPGASSLWCQEPAATPPARVAPHGPPTAPRERCRPPKLLQHPRLPALLALLALLLLPPALIPAAAGRVASRSGGGDRSRSRAVGSGSGTSSTSSSSSHPLFAELTDLRQLQQISATVGFVGRTTSPDPHRRDGATNAADGLRDHPTAAANTTNTSAATTTAAAAASRPAGSVLLYELPGSPEELTSCINDHQPNGTRGTSWDGAMRDAPAFFKVVGMWWSRKAADVPLTITTQLSWNRKWQLKAMCRSWGGPIAAVMHMPVLLSRLTRHGGGGLSDVSAVTLGRAVAKVAAFHAKLDAAQPCKLDLMLLAEPYVDGKSLVLYPVNTLRNYARLMARTPLIGLIDVDLIVSSSLRAELLDPGRAAAYVRQQAGEVGDAGSGGEGRTAVLASTGRSRVEGVPAELAAALNLTAAGEVVTRGSSWSLSSTQHAAWVLPAFATRGGSTSLQVERAEKLAASGSKAKLRPYYQHGKVLRFDWGSTGHRNTNYGKWFSTSEPYIVDWSDRYEPWVFVDRLGSSWADARFRGYGKNKISHIRTLAYDGYELVVHPTAFLIHRPHLESSSSNAHARGALYGKKTKTSSMYAHNVYLYKTIEISMAYGNYTPFVDPAIETCRKKLSWWQQLQQQPPQQQQQAGS